MIAVRTLGTGATFFKNQLPCAFSQSTGGIKHIARSIFSLPTFSSSYPASSLAFRISKESSFDQSPILRPKYDSECELVLYHLNKDLKPYDEPVRIGIVKETAKKASDLASAYFDVKEEWGRKLIKSVFLDDIDCNWYEFTHNNSDILGIRIAGNRNIVFNAEPEEFYSPIKGPVKLSVTDQILFSEMNYVLGYEQLLERKKDFSMIALFNATTFNSFKTLSTNLGILRMVEKLQTPV